MNMDGQAQPSHIFEAIEQFRGRALDAVGTHCVAFVGRGTTRAGGTYVAAHALVEGANGATVYMPIRPQATVAELTRALMAQVLGAQHIVSGHTAHADNYDRLMRALHDRAIALIILDDVQNLGLALSSVQANACVDWLQVLIQNTEMPVLIVGEGPRIEPIMASSTALSGYHMARGGS